MLFPAQEEDSGKAHVARMERERLRMQAKFKKDQLDKVREEQNNDAATGEVLCHTAHGLCTSEGAVAVKQTGSQ